MPGRQGRVYELSSPPIGHPAPPRLPMRPLPARQRLWPVLYGVGSSPGHGMHGALPTPPLPPDPGGARPPERG